MSAKVTRSIHRSKEIEFATLGATSFQLRVQGAFREIRKNRLLISAKIRELCIPRPYRTTSGGAHHSSDPTWSVASTIITGTPQSN
jgi:hypothetical protein